MKLVAAGLLRVKHNQAAGIRREEPGEEHYEDGELRRQGPADAASKRNHGQPRALPRIEMGMRAGLGWCSRGVEQNGISGDDETGSLACRKFTIADEPSCHLSNDCAMVGCRLPFQHSHASDCDQ
jgi:hypothetical protein